MKKLNFPFVAVYIPYMPMYQIPEVEGRILYKSIEFFKYELQNCKKISFAKVLID